MARQLARRAWERLVGFPRSLPQTGLESSPGLQLTLRGRYRYGSVLGWKRWLKRAAGVILVTELVTVYPNPDFLRAIT